jgi:sec-independent protein translocase protein TatA
MFGLNTTELVIILVIVLIIFGGGKLAGVGRSLGSAINEFKTAIKPEDKSNDSPKKEA